MRLLKNHLFASLKKSSLFIFLLGLLIACNTSDENKVVDPLPTSLDPTITETKGLIGSHFYELELADTNYVKLKGHFPGTDAPQAKLVFQFYFNKAETYPPSLIAYASKKKNEFKKSGVHKFIILTITDKESIPVPDEFVLGDQQVKFSAITSLLSGAGNPANYKLIFKPKDKGGLGLNIYYEICVKFKNSAGTEIEFCGGDPGVPTQPSPPADAN